MTFDGFLGQENGGVLDFNHIAFELKWVRSVYYVIRRECVSIYNPASA